MKNRIPGGLARNRKPSDFPRAALLQGIRVEMEHTSDPAVAREIAMDHLTENVRYYDDLAEMERKAKKREEKKAMKSYDDLVEAGEALRKGSAGEGSRGGHVVGHTSGGRAIYEHEVPGKRRKAGGRMIRGESSHAPQTVRMNVHGDKKWYAVNAHGVWGLTGHDTHHEAIEHAKKVSEIHESGREKMREETTMKSYTDLVNRGEELRKGDVGSGTGSGSGAPSEKDELRKRKRRGAGGEHGMGGGEGGGPQDGSGEGCPGKKSLASATADLEKAMATKEGKKLTFAQLEAKIRASGSAADPAAVAAKVYRASGADPAEEKKKKHAKERRRRAEAAKSMSDAAEALLKSLGHGMGGNDEWLRQFYGHPELRIKALELVKREIELQRKYKEDDGPVVAEPDPKWKAYRDGRKKLEQQRLDLERELMDAEIASTRAQQKAEATRKGEEPGDLVKGGEGSRGGKVIGHTASGRPVYDSQAGKEYLSQMAAKYKGKDVSAHLAFKHAAEQTYPRKKNPSAATMRAHHAQVVHAHNQHERVTANEARKSLHATPIGTVPNQGDFPLPYGMQTIVPRPLSKGMSTEHVGITGVELNPDAMSEVLSIIPPGSGGFEYEDKPGLAAEGYESIAECLEKQGVKPPIPNM